MTFTIQSLFLVFAQYHEVVLVVSTIFLIFSEMSIPRRAPFPQVSVSVGSNGSSSSVSGGGGGSVPADARNVLSPHTEEMNILLAENIDSILGSTKIEKGMARLALVSWFTDLF
jgi:hypothetical protein